MLTLRSLFCIPFLLFLTSVNLRRALIAQIGTGCMLLLPPLHLQKKKLNIPFDNK